MTLFNPKKKEEKPRKCACELKQQELKRQETNEEEEEEGVKRASNKE